MVLSLALREERVGLKVVHLGFQIKSSRFKMPLLVTSPFVRIWAQPNFGPKMVKVLKYNNANVALG